VSRTAEPSHVAASRWFDNRFRSPNATRSLYCFPFAGGSASYYASWAPCFTGAIELVPVALPGREARIAEPGPASIGELADDLAELIAAAPSKTLLFGHSMGAIIAFEVARRLQGLRRPPEYLFVSGRPAPPISRPESVVSTLPRTELIGVLRGYGSAPEEFLGNDELLDLLLPMIRADFALIERYRYVPGPRLACPILGWCGDSDPDVTPAAMAGWKHETTGTYRLIRRTGGHFFLNDHHEHVAAAIHRAASRSRP
jgi:medium-chain acyl-[acyl-carrier-protein] hydrolase